MIAGNLGVLYQHYPPGTQEIYNSFSSRNLMMENGKKLEFPEGREGVRGLESAKRILMTGGFPLFHIKTSFF